MDERQVISTTSISAVNGTDEREARSKFWIAAYIRPKSEKKTASEQAKMGVETHIHTRTVIRQWSDRKKKMEVVVIPIVLFAKVDLVSTVQVRNHSLVLNELST